MCDICERYKAEQLRNLGDSTAAASGASDDLLDKPKKHVQSLPVNAAPDSSAAAGTDTGLAERDQIVEMFVDARETEKPKAVPQTEWKRLGIGYAPVGGQQFPEACAFEMSELGPQGEPLFRYSEDQPRDPDGKFAGGDVYLEHVNKIMHGDDANFEHQKVLDDQMSKALKDGNVESYSAFKAASNSLSGNEQSQSLSENAKSDAIATLKEHVSIAQKEGDPKRAAAFKAGIDLLSKRSLSEHTEERYSEDQPRDPDGKFAGEASVTVAPEKPADAAKEVAPSFKEGDRVKNKFGEKGTVHKVMAGGVLKVHTDKGELVLWKADKTLHERSAVRQPAFDFAAVPLYGPQGEVLIVRSESERDGVTPVTR